MIDKFADLLNIWDMNSTRGSFLFDVAGRAVGFLFTISVLLLLLYLLGNYQEFLDATQTFLLKLLTGSTLLEVLIAIYYLGFLSFWAVKYRIRYTLRIIFTAVSLVFCSLVLVAVKFLSAWLTWIGT